MTNLILRRRLVLLLTTLLLLIPATAFADSLLNLGGTLYYESSRLEGEEQVSVQERDQSFDYRNSNFLSARVLYLRPYSGNLYIGAGADFLGNYRANILDDGEPSDPPDLYEFGPLLSTFGLAEWRLDIGEGRTLGLGTELGLATLFPRGDLASEIRALQNDDVRTFNIPRVGWSVGGHTAFVWEIDDRLALRSEVGVQWQNIYLFRSSQTIDDVAFRKQWTTGALRGRLGVSLEIRL